MVLRYKEIAEIISLIDSSSCDEIVLETDEIKLVVRRRGAGNSVAYEQGAPRAAPASPAPAAPAGQPAPQSSKTKPAPAAQGGVVVSSPMVGTFYRAPSPDSPPFVEVGGKVKVGDPLCVIEVMKLFTTIHAEFGGTVREIGADNAQLVEFGQMLFVIDPA
ncbi:MAG: acetyl-CoA carboxylase biotin carboxyl carrier protein [Pseudomonadota bacterium]|nr:acetyl-CoA carboxylase biotin carboxyl carrier protein [Pseudomonadota bacterium]